jgi:MFS transporter, MCT family, solute carrier family 16 (monocarboxylic acid transporters), member 14
MTLLTQKMQTKLIFCFPILGCLILSVFAKNVFTLYITIGFGTGFGFGMIYLPAIVSVTMYFEKYRSLATGIAVCGSGFGTVVFAPLTNYLIVNYKWQGALLVIAGVVFFCSVFGYMFKPLNLDEVESQTTPSINGNNNNNNNNVKYNSSDRDFSNSSLLSPNNHQQIIRSHSIGNDMIKNGSANGKIPKDNDEKSRLALSLSQPLLNDSKDTSLTSRSLKSAGSGTLNRPDAFYTGSLHNIAKHRSTTSVHSGGDRYGSLRRRSENQEVDDRLEVCGCIPCSQETHDTITQMMSFSLLKDPVFILFTVSNFLTRFDICFTISLRNFL